MRTSLTLEFFFEASSSSDDDVIRESVLNDDSELALVKQVSFGFEEEVNLYRFVFPANPAILNLAVYCRGYCCVFLWEAVCPY